MVVVGVHKWWYWKRCIVDDGDDDGGSHVRLIWIIL